jgi:hypothetical protein
MFDLLGAMEKAATERELVAAIQAWHRAGAPSTPPAMRAAALALSARYVKTAWFQKLEHGLACGAFVGEPTYNEKGHENDKGRNGSAYKSVQTGRSGGNNPRPLCKRSKIFRLENGLQ